MMPCLMLSLSNSCRCRQAAALGARTWILLPCVPDWRWLLQRRDSPWYPTVTLYRQPSPGDWDSVLSDVQRDLVRLSGPA